MRLWRAAALPKQLLLALEKPPIALGRARAHDGLVCARPGQRRARRCLVRLPPRRPADMEVDAALNGELGDKVVLPCATERPQVDARVAQLVVLGDSVPVKDVQLQRLGQ